MKIITVNLPKSYIAAIESLCGTEGDKIYPSRSELIRVAVREFLIKELEAAKAFVKYEKCIVDLHKKETQKADLDDMVYVQVPLEKDGSCEYKTYKIIKK